MTYRFRCRGRCRARFHNGTAYHQVPNHPEIAPVIQIDRGGPRMSNNSQLNANMSRNSPK